MKKVIFILAAIFFLFSFTDLSAQTSKKKIIKYQLDTDYTNQVDSWIYDQSKKQLASVHFQTSGGTIQYLYVDYYGDNWGSFNYYVSEDWLYVELDDPYQIYVSVEPYEKSFLFTTNSEIWMYNSHDYGGGYYGCTVETYVTRDETYYKFFN